MFLKLRVLFTILSAICLAFAITAGFLWGAIWAIILALGALLFYLLMRIFKQCQENEEAKNNGKQPSFLDPAPTKEIIPQENQTKAK